MADPLLRSRRRPRQRSTNGLGVDASGGPVIDPTENVVALSEAATKRQDDLRELTVKMFQAEVNHLHDMTSLRAEHAKEIGAMEANRLNSIRQVDVLAVSTTAAQAQTAIQTLAATTAASAETLRNALATTAQTVANQLTATTARIEERISGLEKSSYTGAGRSSATDPMMEQLIGEVRALRGSQNMTIGKSEGLGMVGSLVLGAIAFIGVAAAIVALIAKI